MSMFQNSTKTVAALLALSLPGCGEKAHQDATVAGLDAARDARSSLVKMETVLPDLPTMEAWLRSGDSVKIREAVNTVRQESEKLGFALNALEQAAVRVGDNGKR